MKRRKKNIDDHKETEMEPLNFLDFIPVRGKEHIQKGWQIGFMVPRFKSRFWTWFFVHIGATAEYIVRLDRMGSEIWGYIDDMRTVREILVRLELHHAKEEGLRDRLVDYLKRLEFHEFIELKKKEDSACSSGSAGD